jgi:hypothetical protein
VFRRKNSGAWWVAYDHRGKEVRESSGSESKADAQRLLKKRLGEMGSPISSRHFGMFRAVDITTPRTRAYAQARLKEGATPATVNRDLAALGRMFTLAVQACRLSGRPHIPKLREAGARRGGARARQRDSPAGCSTMCGARLSGISCVQA